MKNILFLILLLFTDNNITAQIGINLSHSACAVTMHSTHLSGTWHQANNEWLAGIKFHYNNPIKPLSTIYAKNLYSDNVWHNIGLSLSFRHYWFKNRIRQKRMIEPYWVGHVELTNKPTRNLVYIMNTNQVKDISSPPYQFVGSFVGAGLKIHLRKQISLNFNYAAGAVFIFNVPVNGDNVFFVKTSTWEFSQHFQGGITYEFINPKPSTTQKAK